MAYVRPLSIGEWVLVGLIVTIFFTVQIAALIGEIKRGK